MILAPEKTHELVVTEVDETTTILIKAKQILKERGWRQGDYETSENEGEDTTGLVLGSVCLVGAINIASNVDSSLASFNSYAGAGLWGSGNVRLRAIHAIREILDEYTESIGWSLEGFNDNGMTTFEDVLLLLDRSIERRLANA